MKVFSGLRKLLIIALLFTLLSAVSGFELLNETSDFGFLMENKIILQEEVADFTDFSEIMADFSVNSIQQGTVSVNNNYNDNMIVFVSSKLNKDSNNALSYTGAVNTITAYTSFEVVNYKVKSHMSVLNINHISELRGETQHSAGRYKQFLFT